MHSTTSPASGRKKLKLKLTQKNLVLLWAQSNQTQTSFCREKKLSLSSFSSWVQKARAASIIDPSSKPKRRKPKEATIIDGFVQANLVDGPSGSRMHRSLIIRTSYGLTLEVPL